MTARVVYRNLHSRYRATALRWSVAELKGARGRGALLEVVAEVVLRDVVFVASAAGSRTIHRTGDRSVVSWCVGEVVAAVPSGSAEHPVSYNPKDRGEESFTVAGRVVTRAAYVRFGADGRAYAIDAS